MGIEGIDQNAVVSSTVPSEYGKAVVGPDSKESQPVSQSVKQTAGCGPIPSHPDPTRFGDWERAGRCVDF